MSRLAQSTRLHMDGTTLHAERATEDGYVTATLNLRHEIESKDGKLVVGAEKNPGQQANSWSSRQMRGTILCASLRVGDFSPHARGTWVQDEIDLDKYVFWQGKELKLGQIAPEDEDDCNDIRLLSEKDRLTVRDGVLFATSKDRGEQSINLNMKLGNNNGSFDVGGRQFSMSTRDYAVDGTILSGMLCKVNRQWERDQIDLRRFIRWRNDTLEFSMQPVTVQRTAAPDCDNCRSLYRNGRFFLPLKAASIRLKPQLGSPSCPVCSLLRLIVREESQPQYGEAECVLHPSFLKSYRQAVVEVNIQPQTPASAPVSTKYIIYNRADPKISSKTFHTIPRNPLPDSWFEPDQRWMLVQGWITNCSTNHTGDCQKEKWPPLPARILDLTAVDQDIVRLVVPDGGCGRYACASYRWGSTGNFTLTTDNISQLQDGGVKRSLLPRTIQDVIDVCRKLGLRYLWVDSLCIQQDSKSDWQVESLKMASYYGNCFISIAATSSPDSDSGWQLHERPTAIKLTGVGPDFLPFRLLAYPLDEIEGFDEQKHFTQVSEKEIAQNFQLLKRGWVYQERRLAPRVLHLCQEELLFECATDIVCECGHCKEYQINWTKSTPEPKLRLYTYGNATPAPEVQEKQKIEKVWRSACAAYSTLDLTFATDKLPAISGFAKSMQFTGRYLAGLWEEWLFADMCWYVGPELVVDDPRISLQNSIREDERRLAVKSRPEPYIAPSWSWASVEEPVTFLVVAASPKTTSYVKLLDATVLPKFDDPMGSITADSHLRLKSRLAKTRWHCDLKAEDSDRWYKLHDVKGMQGQFGMFPFAGQSANNLVRPGHPDEVGPEEVRFLPDYGFTSSPAGAISTEEQLYMMPLQSEVAYLHTSVLKEPANNKEVIIGPTGGTYGPSGYAKVSALVLRRIQEHQLESETSLPVFERVGFTWFFAKKPLQVESGTYSEANLILI